ncbi:MAG: cupredoxin domain-containing protein [Deltaproteobacteria bacterium]|nr:cupredoxin domain-containing protein [Deltaproteobacteria bacterium]
MRTSSRSLLLAAVLAFAGGSVLARPGAAPPKPAAPAPAAQRIAIEVTRQGFTPDRITVAKGQPVVLAFKRTTDKTCAKNVVVELGDGKKVQKDLPLDQTVEIAATFAKAGTLSYACGMDMVTGVLTVQ